MLPMTSAERLLAMAGEWSELGPDGEKACRDGARALDLLVRCLADRRCELLARESTALWREVEGVLR